MSGSRRLSREARKQLLQLEAEMHRLELAAALPDLREPFVAARQGSWLLRLVQNPGGWVVMLPGLFASGRLAQWARLAPLALGAWKVARLLRKYLRRGAE